jgi:hypothetical protein
MEEARETFDAGSAEDMADGLRGLFREERRDRRKEALSGCSANPLPEEAGTYPSVAVLDF